MKRYFKFQNLLILSLSIAVLFLIDANQKSNQEIEELNKKIISNSEPKLRLLESN